MSAKIEVKAETSSDDGRNGWSATFEAGALRAASTTKAEYHKRHADDWSKRYAEALTERKATERVDEVPVTGGMQRTIRYDPGLDAKVNLALNKRDNHRSEQRAFEAWVRFFSAASGSLALRISDVRYFFDEDAE